ncbi:MAG: AAA family ATPase [Chloroflexota bacterium]
MHVHLVPDGREEPVQPIEDFIDAAIDRGIEVLGVTDHNSARFVRDAVKAAEPKPLLVLPGVEVTSRDGHVLALFSPDALDDLDAFATPDNLDLGARLPDGTRRSSRTMLHLLNEIGRRKGIAIIAHCDADDGIQASIARGELVDVLSHPVLAGVEFYDLANLRAWFSEGDTDESRRDAWLARQRVEELRERGLARVMSSDAHDSSLVGKDGTNRPLTRLRVGDITYTAVKNALVNNPKSRCKLEAELPASFSHLLSATFEGGFLDGVTMDFAQNLNCLIGGRGSGKSTALLAMRAALGSELPEDEDPDDPQRMPERTIVRFVDAAGTERAATRERGQDPYDEAGFPVDLPLADLGQGETGLVASDYRTQRLQMLAYLDTFCELDKEQDAERDVLDRLADNAAEVIRTAFRAADYKQAADERTKLEATIKAAETGKLEEIAKWARLLASQAALIDQIQERLERLAAARATAILPDLDAIASETNTDLGQRPISLVRQPLEKALDELNRQLKSADAAHTGSIKAAAVKVTAVIAQWQAEHARWETRRQEKQKELESQGLRVQVGALRQMGERLGSLTKRIAEMEEKRKLHTAALKEREGLLLQLRECRRLIYERRRATLRLVTKRANESTRGMTVSVSYTHAGVRKPWRDWLGPRFGFKADRLRRLVLRMLPWEFAEHITLGDLTPIATLIDTNGDGQRFFTTDDMEEIASLGLEERFELETMRLEDLPQIDVKDAEHGVARGFDHLSTGQQHSVLLSLLLCADRSDPLVIDQPEDHLDAPYIASAVVGHLEQAKERRQVVIATHNANLTVLGDAELVVPLYAEEGRGKVLDAGAVDHPATLRHVCQLLEGGAAAYARRGQRYGFDVGPIPKSLSVTPAPAVTPRPRRGRVGTA